MQVRKLFHSALVSSTEYSQKKWCPPVQLTHGEQWKSTQSGRFPQSRGAESEATRFCRCLGDLPPPPPLDACEIMTPPSAPTTTAE